MSTRTKHSCPKCKTNEELFADAYKNLSDGNVVVSQETSHCNNCGWFGELEETVVGEKKGHGDSAKVKETEGWTPCAEGCPGWEVFDSDSRGFEIERCDMCNRFADDYDALLHVRELAMSVERLRGLAK